jgi:outer membrane protein
MSFPRHIASLVAFLLLAGLAHRAEAQEIKIGVVDLQRAMNETEDGRRAKRRLKTLFDKRQKELDGLQEELKKMGEQLEAQKNVLAENVLRERYAQYQQKLAELQQLYMESQRELAAKEAEFTQQILERMQAILRRIGQTEGFTLIVESNEGGVVFAPTHLDLTDRVIQRYNAENPARDESSSSMTSGAKKTTMMN